VTLLPSAKPIVLCRPPGLAGWSTGAIVTSMNDLGRVATIASVLIASLALWVAWDWRRKTTRYIIKLYGSHFGFRDDLPSRVPHAHFCLYIKNLGLPLPSISATLWFRDLKTHRAHSVPLRCIALGTEQQTLDAASVACNQVVRFGWTTDQLTRSEVDLLVGLADVRK